MHATPIEPAPSGTDAPTQATTVLPVLDHAVRARALHVPRLEPGAYLAVEDGGEITVIPLQGPVVRLGRSFSADLRLENPTVSRRHAVLSREGRDWVLLDDRSANGCWVDGQRVTRAVLRDGNRLRLGSVAMTFVVVDEPDGSR